MKTFKFGILGHKISYSLSPKIFRAIFEFTNIDGETSVLDWNLEELKTKSKELLDFDGLSVTIPYKKEIIQFLDTIEEPVNLIQSANSIFNNNNQLIGYNTDYKGFSIPLEKYSKNMHGSNLLLFGYGGSAKAVLYAMIEKYEISQVDIVIRDKTKIDKISKEIENIFLNLPISVSSLDDKIDMSKYKLIVNATPLGSINYPNSSPFGNNSNLNSDSIYYDLSYNENNKAIKFAKDHDLTVIDGKQMLIGQAIESFKIWTSINVPFEVIFNKVFSESG
jgi:shikimate dehydrogenase